MEIIDVHTHTPIQEETWEVYLKEMRANRISIAFTSSLGAKSWSRFPDSAETRAANDQAAKFSRFSGGMVFWLAYLNPQNEDALEELERCVKLGCRGIKLWVSLRPPEGGSIERCYPLLERAGELGLVVKIHTFHRTDAVLSGEVGMQEVVEFATHFPKTKIIAAHAGANWRLSHGLLKPLPNLYVDVSGSNPQTGFVESLCKWIPLSHILYGSDALGRSFASQIAKVTCADISEKAKQAILFDNAVRLFRITKGELVKARAKAATISLPSSVDAPDCNADHTFIIDLPGDQIYAKGELENAIRKQREYGISLQYAAYGNSIFSTDLIAANSAFKKLCARRRGIIPLATLSPRFVNWRETIAEAVRDGFRGGMLFPYLGNWNLGDESYLPFFEECARVRLPLWIGTVLYEYRFRHPGMCPRPVETKELLEFLRWAPVNDYVIQGLNATDAVAVLGTGRQDIRLDVSRLVDGTDALRRVVERFGSRQLVLGSEYPVRPAHLNREILATLCMFP